MTGDALIEFYKVLPAHEKVRFEQLKDQIPSTKIQVLKDPFTQIEGSHNLEKVILQLSRGKSLIPLLHEKY